MGRRHGSCGAGAANGGMRFYRPAVRRYALARLRGRFGVVVGKFWTEGGRRRVRAGFGAPEADRRGPPLGGRRQGSARRRQRLELQGGAASNATPHRTSRTAGVDFVRVLAPVRACSLPPFAYRRPLCVQTDAVIQSNSSHAAEG